MNWYIKDQNTKQPRNHQMEDGYNQYLAGFNLGNKYFYIYPNGLNGDITLHFNVYIHGITNYQPLGFENIPSTHTIGIGFDTYSRTLTVRYKEQIKKFIVSTSDEETKVEPAFLQASNGGTKDKISVNFGQKEFDYSIPFGYSPWIKTKQNPTCIQRRSNNYYKTSLLILIFYI